MHQLVLALEIVLISAILSVDNALVIGLATRHLPERLRKRAIWWGTMGAVAMRIVMAMIAVVLIETPYLKLIGGIFLLVLAYKMLDSDPHTDDTRRSSGLFAAVQTIIIADLMVSVDNVLAIVAIAEGSWLLLALGILVSIPSILWGSHLISNLLHRYPILLYAGVAVLSWTGASMIVEDRVIARFIEPLGIPEGAFHFVALAATGLAGLLSRRRVT